MIFSENGAVPGFLPRWERNLELLYSRAKVFERKYRSLFGHRPSRIHRRNARRNSKNLSHLRTKTYFGLWEMPHERSVFEFFECHAVGRDSRISLSMTKEAFNSRKIRKSTYFSNNNRVHIYENRNNEFSLKNSKIVMFFSKIHLMIYVTETTYVTLT